MLSTSKSFFRKPGGGATPATDASFAYVPLLTETGSVSVAATTVADGALTPNTVTRNNSVSTGWTSPYQTDGYWSNQFPGSSSLTAAYNAAFDLAAVDFTIETWALTTDSSSNYPSMVGRWQSSGNACWDFRPRSLDIGNFFCFVYSTNGTAATLVNSSTSISDGAWHHLVAVRSGNNFALFVDGVRKATANFSGVTIFNSASAPLNVGYDPFGATYYNGYLSNTRVVKGTAVYDPTLTTLTVPTTPLTAITNTVLLTCQSNRFKDNSSNAFALTVNGTPSVQSGYYPFAAPTASPGAALLNGTNQYLSVPNNAVFNMGGADFTIECWYYPLVSTPSGSIYSKRATTAVYGNVQLGFGGALTPQVLATFDNATWGIFITSSIACVLNSWNHIALSRSGSSWRLFVNGSLGASTTSSSSVATNSIAVSIGAAAADGGGVLANGYISNFRFVNGNAVYTSAFTLPTAPLAATQSANSNGNPSAAITGTQTSLLLGLADSNYTSASSGGTNNTFIDDSTNAFTITRNGTPTQGSRTPYWPNGQWSNYFAASGDYISVPDAANLELGASDFQMSAWVYLTAYPANNLGSYASAILSKGTFAGTRSYSFTIDGSSATTLTVGLTNAGGTATNISGSFSFALNTWYAVRATRVSNRVYLFVNGTLLNAGGTAYTDTVSNGTDTLKVGRANLDVNYLFQLFGYVSNVSLAIGGTGYSTANYTPATTPTTATSDIKFLSCQSNRFKDNSSVPAVVTVTGTPTVQAFQPFSPAASYSAATYAGSGFFNGSTDYLTAASNAAFTLGSSGNNFTIECWVYANGLQAANATVLTTYNNFNSGYLNRWFLGFSASASNSTLTWYNSAGTGATVTSSFPLNSWVHVAVVRNSGTITIYVNGASLFTQTTNQDYTTQGALSVGFVSGAGYFNGYISNARLVNGTAIAPPAGGPTTPVTNTAQTSLLLNMANAGIYDAAAQNVITTVGNAQVSTAQSKWSPSSMAFDGTTDALSIPSSTSFGLGTGNWTIEFWVYLNATTSQTLVSMLTADAGVAPHIYYANASGIRYFTNNSDRITGGALTTGVWNYIALTKASGTTRMYINGTQTGSNYTDANNYGTANPLAVGDYRVPLTGVSTLNGYVQDLRITKGVARTITTPTAAFPTR